MSSLHVWGVMSVIQKPFGCCEVTWHGTHLKCPMMTDTWLCSFFVCRITARTKHFPKDVVHCGLYTAILFDLVEHCGLWWDQHWPPETFMTLLLPYRWPLVLNTASKIIHHFHSDHIFSSVHLKSISSHLVLSYAREIIGPCDDMNGICQLWWSYKFVFLLNFVRV